VEGWKHRLVRRMAAEANVRVQLEADKCRVYSVSQRMNGGLDNFQSLLLPFDGRGLNSSGHHCRCVGRREPSSLFTFACQ
jgi:hypothetical protein